MRALISKLKDLSANLISATSLEFKRFLYKDMRFEDRLIGLIGPRGVGKTTLILQYLKETDPQLNSSLYFTADFVALREGELFELAKVFHIEEAGKLLCIDEVHRYKNWNQELKNIYDLLPQLKVIFSGSSSIDLLKGEYDLSRRVSIFKLPGLSFREYLKINQIFDVPSVSLEILLSNHQSLSSDFAGQLNLLRHFKEYLAIGYYPFYLEIKNTEQYYQRLFRIIEKTIYEDIASVFHINTENLTYFGQILDYLALIPPGEFSVNKVSKLLGKNHETINNYLAILVDSCLLTKLNAPGRGKATLKNLKKVFLENTNLLFTLASRRGHEPALGTLRELFVINQLKNSENISYYSEVGDLQVNNKIFEIGGKSKTNKQIQSAKNSLIIADDILVSSSNRIPIYLFGFLY